MDNKRWLPPEEVAVSDVLLNYLDAHPLVSKTLVRRGYGDLKRAKAFLDPDHYRPASPDEFPGMGRACDRVFAALESGKRIAVWGDFDVDGQASTALLVSALGALTDQEVSFYIPLRDSESHGLNIPGLKKLLQPDVGLLVTCDTGVDDHDAVKFARQQGVEVIITDHHEIPENLPDAAAVINPGLLPDDHPSHTLPGAGTAFKLIEELYHRLGKSPDHLLDLVALAVVSDVAVQTGDTRYMLQRGLESLRGHPRPAIRALCEVIDLAPDRLTENELGFQIGPRLNAVGRLADANPAVDFLTAASVSAAKPFALHLEILNQRRRKLTETIYHQALEMISSNAEYLEDYQVLMLSSPDWHPGVIGIVASRLAERFRKPVVLLVEEGQHLRGSARSVEGVSIIEVITRQSALLSSFGGHPMAAGMQLPVENLSAFRRRLSQSIKETGFDPAQDSILAIDGILPFSELSLALHNDLSRLAPFGPGNPPLTLATEGVTLLDTAAIGRDQNHRKLTVKDAQGTTAEVLWWNSADLPTPPDRFDLAYQLSENIFRGSRSLQLTLQDLREPERDHSPAVIRDTGPHLIDRRTASHPLPELKRFQTEYSGLQVWNEALPGKASFGHDRRGLHPSPALAVWTRPASGMILSDAIKTVDPDTVIFFSVSPPFITLSEFLRGLIGMVKYDLQIENYNLDLHRLAAASSQTAGVVWAGLQWMEASGHLRILSRSDSTVVIQPENPAASANLDSISSSLKRSFAETIAYRLFYHKTHLENLI